MEQLYLDHTNFYSVRGLIVQKANALTMALQTYYGNVNTRLKSLVVIEKNYKEI